jgi:pilus assembly protein CpaF
MTVVDRPTPAIATPPFDDAQIAALRSRLAEALRHDITTDVGLAATRIVRSQLPLADEAAHHWAVQRLVAEVTGLGRLEDLLADPSVTEVMVNAGTQIWAERDGRLEHHGALAAGEIDGIIERILRPLGRRLDRVSPVVDARLPDGSRVCAAVPPIAADGPCLSIRRFSAQTLPISAFADASVAALLRDALSGRCNIVVSGPTSSGKTTLLNSLLAELAPGERVVTIEDTTELRVSTPNTVRLEARDATADGLGGLAMSDLLRAALRLRPDRLVVGEVRGEEAVTLLSALSTGHDGSLATVHANGPLDALRRLEAMVLQGSPSWPLVAVRDLLHASVDLVVHVVRGRDGRRAVAEVAEVVPPDGAALERVRSLVVGGVVRAPLRRVRAMEACE